MNKETVNGMWNGLRMANGITFRVIDAIPKDKIDARPVRDMRTPKELIAHMYSSMRCIAEGIVKGEIHWSEDGDKAVAAGLKTSDDVQRYATESWKAADRAIQSLTDAQAAGMVKTPWGMDFPGFVCVSIIHDEHFHHRGQLYAYLRQMGIAPPFMWDFENSAPEYRPQAAKV